MCPHSPRPPPLPSLPHSSWRWRRQLSSASSPKFALTLGITDPYLVLRCLKRLNTAHGVPDTFLSPPPSPAQSGTVLEQALVFAPPPPITKSNTAEVSECQQARVCLTFAKCHGILGSLHQQEAPRNPGGRGRAWWAHRVPPGGTLAHTHLWVTAGVGEPELDGAPAGGCRPAGCFHASLRRTNGAAVS